MIGLSIVFVVLGVSLAIGLIVINDVQDEQLTTTTSNVANTTFTPVLDTGVDVAASGHDCTAPVCQVYNTTDGDLIPATNYTVGITAETCSVTVTFTDNLHTESDKNLTCSYTRADENYFYNVTQSGLSGVDEYQSWLPTIAVVVAATIVLLIVVTFLVRRIL